MNTTPIKNLSLLAIFAIGNVVGTLNAATTKDADALYQSECASCHLAYPAWLLPARSWHTIMQNLDRHYGDNATVDTEIREQLEKYLMDNSADYNHSRYALKLQRRVSDNDTPTRITQLPYFQHEHDEIPRSLVEQNSEVKSLSNCGACHTDAEQGYFNERRIRIPGYGRWDD